MWYALFARFQKDRRLFGLNSREHQNEILSSYLGKIKDVCWTLDETPDLVQGRRLVLWTEKKALLYKSSGRKLILSTCMMFG